MGFGGGFRGGSGVIAGDQEVSGSITIAEEQSATPAAPSVGGVLYTKAADPTFMYYRGRGGAETKLAGSLTSGSTLGLVEASKTVTAASTGVVKFNRDRWR